MINKSLYNIIGSIFVLIGVYSSTVNAVPPTDHWFYEALQAWDKRDYPRARILFTRSAKIGNAEACYNLAVIYQKGYGVRRSQANAIRWFKIAAQRGHAAAQYTLARFVFAKRRKSARDMRNAKHWLTSAARQNHSPSMYWLGTMYTMGQGVRTSHKQAAHWYLQAAQSGYGTAQLHMARIYSRGIGISRNKIEAYAWARLAMRQGVARARQNWRYITRKMPADQRRAGERLAQRYYKLYLK